MVDAGNGGVSDNKTLHYTGSNPVLTTCFGGRLLLIHRNLHNGESVELDFYSVYIKKKFERREVCFGNYIIIEWEKPDLIGVMALDLKQKTSIVQYNELMIDEAFKELGIL